mgnify:CR=1 FL=1
MAEEPTEELPKITAWPQEKGDDLLDEVPFPNTGSDNRLHSRRRGKSVGNYARGPPQNQRGWKSDERRPKGAFGRGGSSLKSHTWMHSGLKTAKSILTCGDVETTSSEETQGSPPRDDATTDDPQDNAQDFQEAKQD